MQLSILNFNSWITTGFQNKMLTVKEGGRNPTYKIVKEQFILVLISQASLSVIFYYNKQNYHMYKYDYYVKTIGNRVTLVKKKKRLTDCSLLFSIYLILLSHCCPPSAHEFIVQTTVTNSYSVLNSTIQILRGRHLPVFCLPQSLSLRK